MLRDKKQQKVLFSSSKTCDKSLSHPTMLAPHPLQYLPLSLVYLIWNKNKMYWMRTFFPYDDSSVSETCSLFCKVKSSMYHTPSGSRQSWHSTSSFVTLSKFCLYTISPNLCSDNRLNELVRWATFLCLPCLRTIINIKSESYFKYHNIPF